MCDKNCNNCEYKEINVGREGHCYMFRVEPEDYCGQFVFSQQAQREMSIALNSIQLE
ncbi:MAG: hypothetical protein ACI92O_000321 [Colwellia sp.]|jgi:hypothetical protein